MANIWEGGAAKGGWAYTFAARCLEWWEYGFILVSIIVLLTNSLYWNVCKLFAPLLICSTTDTVYFQTGGCLVLFICLMFWNTQFVGCTTFHEWTEHRKTMYNFKGNRTNVCKDMVCIRLFHFEIPWPNLVNFPDQCAHPRYQAHITIMTLVEVATDFSEIKIELLTLGSSNLSPLVY